MKNSSLKEEFRIEFYEENINSHLSQQRIISLSPFSVVGSFNDGNTNQEQEIPNVFCRTPQNSRQWLSLILSGHGIFLGSVCGVIGFDAWIL